VTDTTGVDEMPRVWLTADLHIGHARIIELCGRPFRDVDHMNDELVRRWNAVVGERDRVYVLGDLALGTFRESMAIAATLRGTKYLVPGNHDRCWPGHRRRRPADTRVYEAAGFQVFPAFISMIPDAALTGGGRPRYQLCHLPVAGESRADVEDRFAEWRPTLRPDMWMLHGHVHEAWKVRPADRHINVGVDVWDFTPVPLESLDEIVRVTAQAWWCVECNTPGSLLTSCSVCGAVAKRSDPE